MRFYCFIVFQQARMDFAEIEVDQKIHKHLIGKQGSTSKYKNV